MIACRVPSRGVDVVAGSSLAGVTIGSCSFLCGKYHNRVPATLSRILACGGCREMVCMRGYVHRRS